MTQSSDLLPPELVSGYVYNRVLRVVADSKVDEDRFPDGKPAEGQVIFTPSVSTKQVISDGNGTTLTREPVTCQIYTGQEELGELQKDKLGELVDEAGFIGGVWLAVGHWTASYRFTDRYSSAPDVEFAVTEEHTVKDPADIAKLAGLTPSPTIKFVVNEQVYGDTLKARNEAQDFRNQAQEAFEKFTWPVHVQDTPPENTDVIWVNPDEPAGTASDYALIAEAAADRAESVLRVDTSVGTRVFVGDTMIHGDTGWRDIEELLMPGWIIPSSTRYALLRRVGDFVYLRAWVRLDDEEEKNQSYVLALPRGFAPSGYGAIGSGRVGSTPTIAAGISSVNQVNLSPSANDGDDVMLNILFQTRQSWPTSLPGIPD